jgi:hypothetical protein
MYPLPRPQSLQRRTTRDLNFGVRSARRIKAFLAIYCVLFFEVVSSSSDDLLPYKSGKRNKVS